MDFRYKKGKLNNKIALIAENNIGDSKIVRKE
jgi:hypothetical protein